MNEVEDALKGLSGCWNLYFPTTSYDSEDADHELYLRLIESSTRFFLASDRLTPEVLSAGELHISLRDLTSGFEEEDIEIAGLLIDKPTFALGCLGAGLFLSCASTCARSSWQASVSDEAGTALDPISVPEAFPLFNFARKVHVRVYDLPQATPLRKLKSNLIGKLVAVRGTVIRVSTVRPILTRMGFICAACQVSFETEVVDGKYKVPTQCAQSPSCRSRVFIADRTNTKTVDWQSIRIQEQLHDVSTELGRMPRSVEVELAESLVDSTVPGDVATIVGQVKVVNTQETVGSGRILDPNRSTFLIYLDGNSIQTSKRSTSAKDADSSLDKLSFSQTLHFKDLYAIREISQQPHLLRLLTASLCPGIFGHHLVKAGLLLALFGGVFRADTRQHKIVTRGDLHILVVGDPGMGKSQMLRATHAIAPRGVFVCGSHSSEAGLTVSLLKEKGSSDFSLEAGALVLADQGVCCVDEFDKIGRHHAALLEAMEQQSISVAKAGIICSLPARCSVIAAANPIGGHYNKAKTVSENIGMTAAILSRFDLIFILVDKPDSAFDQRLSEHVMRLHATGDTDWQDRATTSGSGTLFHSAGFAREPDEPLGQYLQRVDSESADLVPTSILRKYIAYARQYCRPQFTREASQILKDYYLEIRGRANKFDSTPVTTRQLESLVRLAEARARCELRDIVTKEDALDVVDLMQESRLFADDDQIGIGDVVPNFGTGKMSKQKLRQAFISVLRRESQVKGTPIFSLADLKQIANRSKLQIDSFEDLLETLNQESYLLRRPNKMFELYG